jgi:hypothetical protein
MKCYDLYIHLRQNNHVCNYAWTLAEKKEIRENHMN